MKSLLRRLWQALTGRYEGPWFARIVTALFCALLIAIHLKHEAWRDELHCWSVGRNSAGLWDLMWGDRRYDGHPFLWYYLIYLVSRVSRAVVTLHALTIAITTAAAYLWLRCSRGPRLLRLLLPPSYLFFYEYGVVCRSYILGVLLLFIFCGVYRPRRVRYVALSAVLVLLALTSVYGAIMSGALALFLYTRGFRPLARDRGGKGRVLVTRPGYWAGMGIYVLGVAVTAATSMPPADEHFAKVWYTDQLGWEHVTKALLDFWWAFFPKLDDWSSVDYVGRQVPWAAPHLQWAALALFLAWLVALSRGSPRAALSFAFATLVMGFFQQAKYPGGLRHVGNVFLFLLGCVWLAERDRRPPRRLAMTWVLLLPCLCVQVVSAYRASRADVQRTFSGALETATFLRQRYAPGTIFVGSNDFIASGVAGYLDRGFVFADTGDFGESVVSHNRRLAVTPSWLQWTAKSNLPGRDCVVLVLSSPFPLADPALRISRVYTSDPSPIVADERLWVYEVRAAPPPAGGR